jgi:glycosyltransferase involved in cell wall biosynthesis
LSRFRLIPNGVDLDRFRPRHTDERQALRHQLGLPDSGLMFLFVGFFSTEKCPDGVFDAWASLARAHPTIGALVFVGATRSRYYEVDPQLADAVKRRAHDFGLEDRVIFVEKTLHIEKYYRAADIFMLPSLREGLPNALMEAMASGMACVSSRLEGVTDDLIEDGVNGLLTPPGDAPALEGALRFLVDHPNRASEMGVRARETIEAHFRIEQTAQQYLDAYRALIGQPACAG